MWDSQGVEVHPVVAPAAARASGHDYAAATIRRTRVSFRDLAESFEIFDAIQVRQFRNTFESH
jgi:hypothetical protein